ncbi:hypothetical protein NAT65_32035, partial [Achromobacter xylosoxidans]|nr:hypothetical protein [Achromobacter xylosoxidans]
MNENNAAQAAQKDWDAAVSAANLAPATGHVVLNAATVLNIAALLSKLRAPVGDSTLPLEQALHELIDKIVPGLDTGDLVQDARRASTALSATLASAPVAGEAVYTLRVRGAIQAWTPTAAAFSIPDGEHQLFLSPAAPQATATDWRDKPSAPVQWPTMPPSKGQSPVLFEDGYAEGWAKCMDECRRALVAASNYIDSLGGDSKTYRAALASAPVLDPEAAQADFMVRLFGELGTWRAEDWNELIERRPAILALLRPLVLASAPVAGEAKNYPGDNVAERLDKMADG